MPNSPTRNPVFWLVFGVLGLGGAWTALQLFTVAMPNVSLEISMDREGALAAAEQLATSRGWGPAPARSAASFGQVDPEPQTYVELEGGGREAFQSLIDAGVFAPWQWRVRRFAEGEVQETEVRFAPDGEPYGFRLRLAEDDPGGGNVDRDAARTLAEREARAWPVDLDAYDLFEASEQTRQGGRVDHAFVFERRDVRPGEARFRLRLVVGGDRLTELTHFVFVPESFSRRYADMRSANDTIALVAQSIFMVVFLLLGAGVGTAILLRQRWVEWRTAMGWGAVTAGVMGLNSLNALPLAWMGYDTAVSARMFVLQNVAAAGAIVVLGTPLLGFFFLAAESLGRRAFPRHPQQWRFWSPAVAASLPALGRTVAAYLLVGVQVGYVVLFYLGTSRLEGWWSPADALVQPDLLATYLPWLQAVAIALFASLWEESIFRAVPIACAALIGAKYGRRSLWVWGAVLVQAVVFAAGHANYPQQPPYARVIELTLPALVWGTVYVRFGLVPTILAHFLYDLALIASVLFASEAFVDQAVIIVVACVPLALVLWARRGGRATSDLPAAAYNGAWTPAGEGGAGPEAVSPEAPVSTGAAAGTTRAAPGGGLRAPGWVGMATVLVGCGVWVSASLRRPPVTVLQVDRSEAIAISRTALETQGYDLGDRTVMASTSNGVGSSHEYVFEEVGLASYDELIGTFLPPPQWMVRFVDWKADPVDRAEEFLVNVASDGSVRRIAHTLPEGRSGATLAQDSARVLARAALPSGDWDDAGAEEATRESRTDWEFTFRDRGILSDVPAEGRAAVSVLGEEVTNVRRFVDVPEEWERARREAESRTSMIGLGLMLGLVLMYGSAAVVAIVVWSRGGLTLKSGRRVGLLTLLVLGASTLNAWPQTVAAFSTAIPFGFQAGGAAFGVCLIAVVAGTAVGLVAALAGSWSVSVSRDEAPRWLGVGIGAVIAGLAVAMSMAGDGAPPVPGYGGAATFMPTLAPTLDRGLSFILMTTALAVLSASHRRFAAHPVLRGITAFAMLALGMVVVPEAVQASLPLWIAAGVACAVPVAVIVHVVGRVPPFAPHIVGAFSMLASLGGLVRPEYAGSRAGALLAAAVVGVLAWQWSRITAPPSGRDSGLGERLPHDADVGVEGRRVEGSEGESEEAAKR